MSFHAIDFGTSNSLLSFISDSGVITSIPLENGAAVLRSLLYTPTQNQWFFGNEAILQYVEQDGEGRFFRSIKKFLPEPSYNGTNVFNRKMNISEMVAVFLSEMKKRADEFTKTKTTRLVLGRPALYSRELAQDQLAQERMHKAALMAGYQEIIFCPEPIAAGLDYTLTAVGEKIVLIADFGGGTSDFTLMKFHSGTYSQEDILGLSGIFKAGDVLDGMMMRDFIAPHFGSKFEYKIAGGNNVLTFPKDLLKKICSPAHITHLKERSTWEFLQHIEKFSLTADHAQKMQQLFTLVECQLGFPLFHEIEKTKISLGKKAEETFIYHYPGIDIEETISNQAYADSVQPTVEDIIKSMMEVFTQANLTPSQVDQVVLTGGTSQFPLIQNHLKQVFGKEKLTEHNIYQSVVSGLAQFAKKQLSL